MEIPEWFGITQYNYGLITVWFGLICWVIVNYFRVKEVKLDIKKKLISFKHWWKKRKEFKGI